MKSLVISTYPPARCGVATYARQQVEARRRAGEEVSVLTWGDGQGDLRLPHTPLGEGVLGVLPFCRGFDRVVFHYMPGFYLDHTSRLSEIRSRLALWRLFRSVPRLEVMVHEQPFYPDPSTLSLPGKILWNLERLVFKAAPCLHFHNPVAIETFRRRFRLDGRNAAVAPHGDDFVPYFTGTRAEARAELGLAPEARVAVSVGFISPRKGYELALEALRQAPDLACEYHIVGTPHPESGRDDEAYLESLRAQAAEDPRVRFHVEFVDDAGFDRWMTAANVVLIPSRAASSSSVLARCRVLGTPAITSAQAGLLAELSPRDRAVQTADELAVALREVLAA